MNRPPKIDLPVLTASQRLVRPLLLPLVTALVMAGCGGGSTGPKLYRVTGTVTFDGAPVDNGRILFRKVEGDQRAFSAEIKEGRYQLEAEPGKMTVEITASRPIPGQFDTSNPDEEPQPIGEMYIPAKYNTETTLTAEVTAGDNDIPFSLTAD